MRDRVRAVRVARVTMVMSTITTATMTTAIEITDVYQWRRGFAREAGRGK